MSILMLRTLSRGIITFYLLWGEDIEWQITGTEEKNQLHGMEMKTGIRLPIHVRKVTRKELNISKSYDFHKAANLERMRKVKKSSQMGSGITYPLAQ